MKRLLWQVLWVLLFSPTAVLASGLQVGEIYAEAGGHISLPVRISGADAALASMNASVHYNPSILLYTGYAAASGSASFDMFHVNRVQAGWLKFGAFKMGEALLFPNGSDVVLLEFDVLKSVTTPVSMDGLQGDVKAFTLQTGGLNSLYTPPPADAPPAQKEAFDHLVSATEVPANVKAMNGDGRLKGDQAFAYLKKSLLSYGPNDEMTDDGTGVDHAAVVEARQPPRAVAIKESRQEMPVEQRPVVINTRLTDPVESMVVTAVRQEGAPVTAASSRQRSDDRGDHVAVVATKAVVDDTLLPVLQALLALLAGAAGMFLWMRRERIAVEDA